MHKVIDVQAREHFPRDFIRLLVATAFSIVLSACGQDPLSAGMGYFKNGDYTAAAIELKSAVQAKPDSAEARLALADALERTYDEIGAEQHLRKAITNGADQNVIFPRIALLMLERKENSKVIQEFKDKKLDSPEANSNIRAAVAVAFLNQNQIPEAKEQLGVAEKTTSIVLLANVQLQLAEGMREQTLAATNASVADSGAPWWVLRGFGRVYEATGDRESAFGFMTKAYESAPWHRGVMGEYGEFLVALGKIDNAQEIANRLKKLAPNYYWTHYLNAQLLSHQGKSEESMAEALKVLRVVPDHLPAALLVSAGELRKGDLVMANTRLQKIATKHPYSVPLLQLLAESQLRLGKKVEAAESIRRGLGVAPNNARLLSLNVDSELAHGRPNAATATLERLNVLFPRNPTYLLRLAEIKNRSGDTLAAKKLLNSAAEAGVESPMVRDRVVAAFLAMGDVDQVEKLADRALQSQPNDPQSHLIKAAAFGARRNEESAWQETLNALALQPTYQPALKALTMLASRPALREQLFAHYEKAVETKGAGEQIYLDYIQIVQTQKADPTDTTEILERAVAEHPNSVLLRQRLSTEYFKKGKSEIALALVQSGASANNAPPEAIALLGATYLSLGDLRLANETYRKLATNFPQRTDWRMKLAELEAERGQKKEASTVLRSLITDRPFDPLPYIALAKLAASDNNQKEAISVAKELGGRAPNQLTALLLEGDLLLQGKQPDEALQTYAQAEKAGAQPAASIRTIQLLDKTNRASIANNELASLMKKFPKDPSVLGFAAQRLRATGRFDEAINMLQTLVAVSPSNPVILNDLAWAQIEAKHPDAIKNAMAASKLAPDNPNILDTLGMAQAASGNRSQAIFSLRMASNLAPKAPTPRLHLAEVLIEAGEKKEAATLLRSIDSKGIDPAERDLLARLTISLGK
jgi:putative PEP-CTERM system TPR-repeat lipoprotein